MEREEIIDAIRTLQLDCNRLIYYINVDENADMYAEQIGHNLNNVEQLKQML